MMLKTATKIFSLAVLILQGSECAYANNVGENGAWQFQTSGDKVNKAVLEDMRLKRSSNYYSAPVYNTTIDKQFNCSVNSVAAGSQGTSTAVGNSPNLTGSASSATGNADTTYSDPGIGGQSGAINGTQSNSGAVGAGATGDVNSAVSGGSYQTLNSNQQNTGNQTSAVAGSSACQFGPLN